MNRKLRIVVLLSCGVVMAAGLAVAAGGGDYQPAALGQLPQAAPAELTPDGNYGGGAYPLYPPELAAGEGKVEVEGYCSVCHSTRYITMQPPLPAGAWDATVHKMQKAYGATIPDAAAAKIISYLHTHYTPETRKQ
ncbi:MAG: sulfide dehydrogenase [Acidobacteriia bacterium]|nr:sulfide dehydrogenase [Terriglobia bacterium]